MSSSLPRKSASVRGLPAWSTSRNGPPIGSLFHITTSISSAALRWGGSAGARGHSSQTAPAAAMPPANAAASTRRLTRSAPARRGGAASCPEGQARAGGRHQELVRHLRALLAAVILAAAVHRHDDVLIELLDLADHLAEVLVRRR